MLSVDDINEMQKTINRQNRIITVLKRIVKQWVKEYNILDDIIDMYKMSENEANEIIAELKAKIKKYAAINEQETKDYAELKAENEQLKALCDTYKTCYQAKHSDIKCLLPKYRTTLQEIKEIAETCMAQDLCTFCKYSDDCLISCTDYDNNKLILQKIAECEVE